MQKAIDHAKSNRSELLKVIKHYQENPADSQKLKAAYFLISNLDGRYYFEGNQLLNYQQYSKLIIRDYNQGQNIMKSFERSYGAYNRDSLYLKYDNREIRKEQLISTIDEAFLAWESTPWHKDYNFKQFCEYVLPFKIEDEVQEYNRKMIRLNYSPLLDSLRAAKGNAFQACVLLNAELKKAPWVFTTRMSFLPHFPASKLLNFRTGTCREMSDLAIYVMRAAGIPVAGDFLPHWPYRGSGHNWNVVFDAKGKFVMFLGAEDNPGTPHRAMTKKAKVYRNIFSINPNSLAAIKGPKDIIPNFLANSRIIDVTDEYVPCVNFDIPLLINKNFTKANLLIYLYSTAKAGLRLAGVGSQITVQHSLKWRETLYTWPATSIIQDQSRQVPLLSFEKMEKSIISYQTQYIKSH